METSSISLKNQTELTDTTSTSSSKNTYSRFFCNLPLLVANFFYVLHGQGSKTTTSSTKNALVPTVSEDNPVTGWDESGICVGVFGIVCMVSEAVSFTITFNLEADFQSAVDEGDGLINGAEKFINNRVNNFPTSMFNVAEIGVLVC